MNDAAKNSLTIDGKTYDVASLTDAARAQVGNIRVVDEEIKKIEQQLAIHRTARAAYGRALKEELDKTTPANQQ